MGFNSGFKGLNNKSTSEVLMNKHQINCGRVQLNSHFTSRSNCQQNKTLKNFTLHTI